jgi:hypothetical protein
VADLVEITMLLKGAQKFISDAKDAGKAVGNVGDQAEESGKKAGIGWKGIAKWAASGAILYGVTKGITSTMHATEDLARSTLALQRNTGLDTQTASEWVGVTKERGISARQLQTSIVKLSSTMQTVRTGSDASRKSLVALGVPIDQLAHGTTEHALLAMADAIQKIHDPSQRTALMLKVFGRSGQALLPVLMQGSAGVHKLLDEQKSYGNYLSGKGSANARKLIQQQRDLNAAWNGAKVQLGQALMPVLVQVGKILVQVAKVISPLTQNSKVMTTTIIALTAAFVAYQSTMGIVTVATELFGASLDALPIFAVITGIMLLVTGFVLLYKHCTWFRNAVNATFDWIKANWRLLLDILVGPIFIAVQLIIKHWAAIKAAILTVWNWVKQNWPLLVGMLFGPFGIAIGLIVTHWDTAKKLMVAAVHLVTDAFDSLLQKIEAIPKAIGGIVNSLPGGKLATHALGSVAHVFGAQHGGHVTSPGTVLVGEGGPELVALPRAATVIPLDHGALAGGSHRPLVIEVPVLLDRREIARATARVTADKMARR